MADPRIEGSLGELEFRRRGATPSRSVQPPDRFWVGVAIFLVVAAVYPFYSYHVQTRLAAAELAAAVGELTNELGEKAEEAKREMQANQARQQARSLEQRRRAVSLAGTTTVGGQRVAIVSFGASNLAESRDLVCRQAARQFREDLAGKKLRVQRHRGRQPAVDEGTITCP